MGETPNGCIMDIRIFLPGCFCGLQFTIAILHTVPFLPSEVAVCTMYTPLATRRPLLSHPSHVNSPPLLLPSATSVPLTVTILTSASSVSPVTVMSPV